jgi:hypothetical protein
MKTGFILPYLKLSSPPVFIWVRVTRSLVLCVCFVLLYNFYLAIVLSVLYCVVVLFYFASSCVPYEDRVYFAIFETVTSQKKLNSNNNKL